VQQGESCCKKGGAQAISLMHWMHHAEGQRGAVMAVLELSVYAAKPTDDTVLLDHDDQRLAIPKPGREPWEVARGEVLRFIEPVDLFARFNIYLTEKSDIALRQGAAARHAELAIGNEEISDLAEHRVSVDA
jgi:hypothetical protein